MPTKLPPKEFTYFLNQKEMILVITLSGMLKKASTPILKQCLDEALALKPKHVVINFNGLTQVEGDCIRPLTQFQMAIREVSLSLTLCSLNTGAVKMLETYGAIRPFEVVGDLLSALQKILTYNKDAL